MAAFTGSHPYINLKNAFLAIRLFGMFEHLRKIPAKDKNILRFSEVSNAWRSKITGYFSKARRTSEQARREYYVRDCSAGAKIVRKFSERGNRLNDRTSCFAKQHGAFTVFFVARSFFYADWA